MVVSVNSPQRIERLAPLADVLARIDQLVQPVAVRQMPLESALGRTLAKSVVIDAAHPPIPLALRDGWAVNSEATIDAGPFAPVRLPAAAIGLGEALPSGTDAVASMEVVVARGDATNFVAPVAPGDGVLMTGVDAGANELLGRAGQRLRSTDIAALTALGIETVLVRAPNIHVAPARDGDRIISAIATLVARMLAARGASARLIEPLAADGLAAALAVEKADAIVVIGGSGSGAHDMTIQTLARVGRVEVHGIGLTPGETAAFGFAGRCPVVVLPGRVDAALAAWLTIGEQLLRRLCDEPPDTNFMLGTLSGKITSTLGFAEVVLVRKIAEGVAPLAFGYLPLQSLTRADGWVLVPADSEGYPSGARVAVRPLP